MVGPGPTLDEIEPEYRRFRDYTYAFVHTMMKEQISLFMTSEMQDLFASTYLSAFGISHMADNVILLHYLREESEVKRAIIVFA